MGNTMCLNSDIDLNSDNKSIIIYNSLMEDKIGYCKVLSKICGYKPAHGIVLSQLCYWSRAVRNREFYKIDSELMDECAMRRECFRAAKKSLIDLGFISIALRGVPAKTYYVVNHSNIVNAILCLENSEEIYRIRESRKLAKTNSFEVINIQEPQKSPVYVKHVNYVTSNTQTNTIDYTKITKEKIYKKENEVEKKKKKEKRAQAHQMPSDYVVPEEQILWAIQQEGADENYIRTQAKVFVNYWLSSGKTKKDWKMTWQNWVWNNKSNSMFSHNFAKKITPMSESIKISLVEPEDLNEIEKKIYEKIRSSRYPEIYNSILRDKVRFRIGNKSILMTVEGNKRFLWDLTEQNLSKVFSKEEISMMLGYEARGFSGRP